MYTVRRIDFEILGMKGFKVKFGVLENRSESWKRSWKSPEIYFGNRVRTLLMYFFYGGRAGRR